jgi:RNA polymerase sigma-70 factor (ECF subfamily)
VGPLIARFDGSADFVDEVRQQLRLRLLAGPAPRIGDYSGSGPLAGWVRVAVSRVALNQLRTMRRRERLVPPAPEQVDTPDPEKLLLDEKFRSLLERAVRAAFAGLDDAQRALLRRHYVERESLEQIARSHGIERSSLSRRVAQVRRTLLEATSRELMRLVPGLTPASRDSLIVALRSRINITLGTVLSA